MVDHTDAWGFGDSDLGFKAPPKESPAYNSYNSTGDRIGTFMGWLSDTYEGGATCFTSPFSEDTTLPVKGAGLFWININQRHKIDRRLNHGGCPVLRGKKWIVNDWIFALDQFRTWKCGTDPDSEYNVHHDFVSKPHKIHYSMNRLL